MKNKTAALWLTLLLGPLGLHRLYLRGKFDVIAVVSAVTSLIGGYGVYRARSLGVDDQLSWALVPLLGFSVSACALNAIVYGLMGTESWNTHFNPTAPAESTHGETQKMTVAGLAVALFFGTSVLMATLAFSFQRYFEYQVMTANMSKSSNSKSQT